MQCWASKKVLPEVKDILGTIHHSYSSLGEEDQRDRDTGTRTLPKALTASLVMSLQSRLLAKYTKSNQLSYCSLHSDFPSVIHFLLPNVTGKDTGLSFMTVISLKCVFPYSLSLGPHKTQELFSILAQDCSQNGAHAC